MYLNINHSAVVAHTNRLEKMKRSALPNAIRNSLNSAAFDVKKTTMPKSAKTAFKKRHNGDFYKANSHVDMAKGWDIKTMKSTVGFVSHKLKGSNNFSIKDLEDQEFGGKIPARSFIALKGARSGNSKPVMIKNRISTLKGGKKRIKLIDIQKPSLRKYTPKQRWIRAAGKALALNIPVLGNPKSGGRRTLSRIDGVFKNSSGKIKIKRTPLYSFKPGYKAPVKGKRFMERATHESGRKINQHFINAAKREFDKLK